MKNSIAKATPRESDRLPKDPGKGTFKSTVRRLDDVTRSKSGRRRATLNIFKRKRTRIPLCALRGECRESVQDGRFVFYPASIIGRTLQGDQAFADSTKVSGEDEKLLNETLRDYRRAVWNCS